MPRIHVSRPRGILIFFSSITPFFFFFHQNPISFSFLSLRHKKKVQKEEIYEQFGKFLNYVYINGMNERG